ncbi:MAG: NAD(+)/NADH kinase [Clostridia bacterium]|nr:NAD(+)/NADH kinase [Clostridia bacterium]
MNVGIICNRKVATSERQSMLLSLRENGFNVIELPKTPTKEELSSVQALLVLGGDGAIIHTAVQAAQTNTFVLGVNYGTLGFLTEYEKQDALKAVSLLKDLKNGVCNVLKRSILEISIKGKVFYALNEVAFQRDCMQIASARQIISVNVKVGNENATFTGDGVILCTPTGSTAYSLSAGGAILSPQVPAFMLTPICAFSFNARPIVFPDSEVFVAKITGGTALLVADGKVLETVGETDEITIKKAPFTANFLAEHDSCLLTKIKNKLK